MNNFMNLASVKEYLFHAVLSGTKYGLKQTRGKFGLGAKMVWYDILHIYNILMSTKLKFSEIFVFLLSHLCK